MTVLHLLVRLLLRACSPLTWVVERSLAVIGLIVGVLLSAILRADVLEKTRFNVKWQDFWLRVRNICLSKTRSKIAIVWWTLYFVFHDIDSFEADYLKAWNDLLLDTGDVEWVNVFTSSESLQVPISYNLGNNVAGCDRDTF